MADITYCVSPDCPFKDCERHWEKAPVGMPVSCAYFDKTCRRYLKWLLYEIERGRDNG